MRNLTYKNMEKATKMIMEKGYDKEEANKLAMNCFANVKRKTPSVEFFIEKILTKEEYERFRQLSSHRE